MTDRLAIAVGGLGYPIQQFIPHEFQHFVPIKTGWRLGGLHSLIEHHKGPITLLGFSWGAEIVIRASLQYADKNIDRVIAHSPGKGVLQRHHAFGPQNCEYKFLVTTGDKVCYAPTKSLFEYFSEKHKTEFKEFPFNEDRIEENIPWVIQKFMIKNNHQFVNAISYLKEINWGL
jgi:pimeloyl-ACP methyl ester carboxylesterase